LKILTSKNKSFVTAGSKQGNPSGEKSDGKVQEIKNNKSTFQTYQRDFHGVHHSSEEDKKFLLPYSLGVLEKALSEHTKSMQSYFHPFLEQKANIKAYNVPTNIIFLEDEKPR
jgi:hypothetical protein